MVGAGAGPQRRRRRGRRPRPSRSSPTRPRSSRSSRARPSPSPAPTPTPRRSTSTRPRTTARACSPSSAWSTPPFVEERSEPGQFLFNVSAERTAELDADVFLTYANSEANVEGARRRPAGPADPGQSPTTAGTPRVDSPRPSASPRRRRCRSRSAWSATSRRSPPRSTATAPRPACAERADATMAITTTGAAGPAAEHLRGRPGDGVRRDARACWLVAAVASVLVGSRTISPTALLEAGPDRTVLEVRAVRTVLGVLVGVGARAGRCVHAGPDPQPAGRPRHPRRQRRCRARDRARHRLPRCGRDDGLRACSRWSVRRSPRSPSTPSPASAATAPPRPSSPWPAPPSPPRRAAGPSPCSWSTRPRST